MPGILEWLSNPIGSAVSAIGGAISNYQNAKENEKNRLWNEKMWNLNNEYNSPKAVLSRFADVGIDVNPNYLVTGSYNGGLSSYAGNLDASRSMENPAKGFNLGILEVKNLQNATRQTDSVVNTNLTQQEKNKAEAKKAIEEANNIIADTENKSLNNTFLSNTLLQRIEGETQKLNQLKNANLISEAQYKQELEKINLFKQQVREAGYRADKAGEEVKTQEAVTANVKSDTLLKDAQRMEAYTASVLNKAKTQTEKYQQQFLKAGANASNANAYYMRQLGDKVAFDMVKTDWDTKQVIMNIVKDSKTIDYIESQTHLNYSQVWNLITMTKETIIDGNWKRYRENVSQKYGTSTLGTILNVINEGMQSLGIPGANTTSPNSKYLK